MGCLEIECRFLSLNVIYQQISVGDLSLKLALRPGQWSIHPSSFHAPIQWTGFDLLPLVQSSEGDPSRGIQPGLPCAKATLVCRFHAHAVHWGHHISRQHSGSPLSQGWNKIIPLSNTGDSLRFCLQSVLITSSVPCPCPCPLILKGTPPSSQYHFPPISEPIGLHESNHGIYCYI